VVAQRALRGERAARPDTRRGAPDPALRARAQAAAAAPAPSLVSTRGGEASSGGAMPR
jgi:hypothetical protein